MQLSPRSAFARVQSGLCVLVVTLGLAVVPGLVTAAEATTSTTTHDECAAAKALLAETRRQARVAHAADVAARKAIRKAAAAHRPAKVKAAKEALAKAQKRFAAVTKLVAPRQARVAYACAAPTSAVRAKAIGLKLGLLSAASGVDVSSLDAEGLTALLEQLLPGVTEGLDAGQLAALLSGFNTAAGISPTQVLALVSGFLDPAQVTDLLGGTASPEVLVALAENVVSQLSGLLGGFPLPEELDLGGLLETLAGLFDDGSLSEICAVVPIPLICD